MTECAGLPDPKAAREKLIGLLHCAVNGMVVRYIADTEAQAEEAFQIAAQIANLAKAPFTVRGPILEVHHPSGGALVCRWKAAEESGEVLE